MVSLSFVLCLLSFAPAQPGNYTTTNKHAIKLYESGADCMRLRKWVCAASDLKKAAEADPKFIEPRIYLAEMYEEEIGELTKSLTTLLEPILMIIMGGVVGFIAISIITPIYSITQNLTPH